MAAFLKNAWSRTSGAQLVAAERALLDKIQSPYGKVLSRPVPIGHGHHINTIILGDPDAPPLVLIHGYGAGVGFWFKNIAGLAAKHRVFAIDLLGFGRSSRPKPQFSHEDLGAAESFFVDSLEQWRKKVGLTNFHLLGHSFGGYISTVYAGKHPEHFENTHLILASPFGVPEKVAPAVTDPSLPPPEPSRSTIYKMIERLWGMNVTPASLVRTFGPMGPYLIRSLASARFRHLPKEEVELIIDYLHHTWAASGSGEFALGALFAPMGWARNPLIHRLKHISAPTSFIYGEYDWMGWEVVDQTIREGVNPNLRSLHVVPGVGHQLFLEDPEGFNRTVSAIIAQPVRSQAVARHSTGHGHSERSSHSHNQPRSHAHSHSHSHAQ